MTFKKIFRFATSLLWTRVWNSKGLHYETLHFIVKAWWVSNWKNITHNLLKNSKPFRFQFQKWLFGQFCEILNLWFILGQIIINFQYTWYITTDKTTCSLNLEEYDPWTCLLVKYTNIDIKLTPYVRRNNKWSVILFKYATVLYCGAGL